MLDVEAVGRGKPGRKELACEPLAHAEQVGQPARLDHRRAHPSAVEPDGARADHDLPFLRLEAADDHLRRAHDLPEPDERRLTEDGKRRKLHPSAGLEPLGARDGPDAKRVKIAGEQRGHGLGDPREMPVALHVLERHDEQPLDRRWRLRAGGALPQHEREGHEHRDQEAGRTARHSGEVTLTMRDARGL